MIATVTAMQREIAHVARRNAAESYKPSKVRGVVLALTQSEQPAPPRGTSEGERECK